MSSATITIRLYATLQRYTPCNADRYPIETGTSLGDFIELLDIPHDQIKLLFVNGVRCELETALNDGDRIGIFPPVGGG